MQHLLYDHESEEITEEWVKDTGKEAGEIIRMNDVAISSIAGEVRGVNVNNGKDVFSVARNGFISFPYENYAGMADSDGGFNILELEMGQLESGGAFDPRVHWELQEKLRTGEQITGDFVIENKGEASKDFEVQYTINPEWIPEITATAPASIEGNEEVRQPWEIEAKEEGNTDRPTEAEWNSEESLMDAFFAVDFEGEDEQLIEFTGTVPTKTSDSTNTRV